jgi:hypothetical protein
MGANGTTPSTILSGWQPELISTFIIRSAETDFWLPLNTGSLIDHHA